MIHYFSGHQVAFGFQASLLPDNITLNPANKRTDQSLSDFQPDIGSAAHVTLNTEQLISDTRTALVDTIASLQHSDCAVIIAPELHELLTKVHDILKSAVSKQIGNMACILSYVVFNFASRKLCKVWASWFPFLHNIKDSVPHSEVGL